MKNNTLIILFLSIILQGCGSSTTGTKSSFSEANLAPVIDAKSNFNVLENKREAFTIKAVDKSLLTYSLSGTDFSDFQVDVLTGEVVFIKAPDFEKKETYKLIAVVEDSVKHRATKEITINIIDVDEKTIPVIIEENSSNSFSDSESTRYFVTRWKTDNEGESNSTQIKIPTIGDDYNYSVDWGDGTSTVGITADIIHTYSIAGTYTVKIDGAFPRIAFSKNHGSSDAKKLLSIERWGAIKWKSMAGAFDGCINLVGNARDKPDLSRVSNMEYMFLGAQNFNQDIGGWDVSNVTNMLCLFGAASSFNQDIGNWNVSTVVNMVGIFFGASNFNQDLNSWNVSNVDDMNSAFFKATSFDGDIRDWNVLSVRNMNNMFFTSPIFNQDISDWNVSAVTNMAGMFFKASSFDQDLSSWNVADTVKTDGMFTDTNSLTALPNWFNR
jgi:surface protein